MNKRIKRLFVPLWMFLLFYLIVTLLYNGQLSVIKIVLNFFGLSWFAKLPAIGHLWFVTMIILCYAMYSFVARLPKLRQINRGGYLLLLISSVLLEYVFDSYGLPGYIFVILFYCYWFFNNSVEFEMKIMSAPPRYIWMVWLPINIFAVYVCLWNEGQYTVTYLRLVCCLTGLSWLIILLRYFKSFIQDDKSVLYRILGFLSAISYEVYLVHHIFCTGTLSVINATVVPILNYCVLWIVTLAFGWFLNRLSSRVNKVLF